MIVAPAALMLLVGIILLESLVVGYRFHLRRDLQKVADLSALAGAQRLHGTDCSDALQSVDGNAAQNGSYPSLQRDCGRWSPTYVEASHYHVGVADGEPNAVHVTVSSALPFALPWWHLPDVTAEAIAIRDGAPAAAFSIGSTLLQLQGGVVPTALRTVIDVDRLDVATPTQLLGASVRTGDLLRALGIDVPADAQVATLGSLLQAHATTLSQLLDALGSSSGVPNLSTALGINAAALGLPVTLATVGTVRGVLTIAGGDGSSAPDTRSILDTRLNALDVVTAALGNVVTGHAFTVDASAASAAVQMRVIEPPSIGIGGVGTTAYSAQVRLYAHLDSSALPAISGLLKSTLVTSADLPIVIDVANGSARLDSMCTEQNAAGNDLATFSVASPLLRVCVGDFAPDTVFSQQASCSEGLQAKQVLNLLNGTVVLKAGFALTPLPNDSGPYTLAQGESVLTGSNALSVGTTLDQTLRSLSTAVGAQLLGTLLNGRNGSQASTDTTAISTRLLAASSDGLKSAASFVNSALAALPTLTNALDATVQALLPSDATTLPATLGAVSAASTTLVGSIQQIVNGLVGGLVGVCGLKALGGDEQKCLASKLIGSTGGFANTQLTALGMVEKLLQPPLDALGAALATALKGFFGTGLGRDELALQYLGCLGTRVRLVH
ncbi:TadG family pilus assembly protein [Chitinasiproducens palmae]|uniref:TadG family pilus assembly protein n=1 Tax=Chitinasiproducens palmae TaxID=1770053 RepID=UPI00147A4BB1|nr:TadG family pilus assembly protein [Chitinasiproducens palmae]